MVIWGRWGNECVGATLAVARVHYKGCGGRPLSHGEAVTAHLTQGMRIATISVRTGLAMTRYKRCGAKQGGGLWSARPTGLFLHGSGRGRTPSLRVYY